jgi:hypothetical protein
MASPHHRRSSKSKKHIAHYRRTKTRVRIILATMCCKLTTLWLVAIDATPHHRFRRAKWRTKSGESNPLARLAAPHYKESMFAGGGVASTNGGIFHVQS